MHTGRKPYWITIYTLIFILVYMLFFQNYWRYWDIKKGETPFQSDADQYYSYLPATFIYHDLDFTYTNRYWLTTSPVTGKSVPKMTSGVAFLMMPFFLLGDKIAFNQKSPRTGYSEPYTTCVHYSCLFYSLMGLVILALVMRRFYSDKITALTLATLFFATNLFFYTLRDGEMSHCYGFFAASLFLWLTCRWHERQKSIYLLWIGMAVGLASLIRPTEILISIIFIGYGVHSFSDLKNKLKKIICSYKNVPLLIVGFLLVWLPQIILWKVKTGSFLFFSYGEEKFFWADPQIFNLLFSYRKGWLVYTPVMMLALISLFFILKSKTDTIKIPLIIYLTLNIYVISSWWCWWYGGGFGMRPMIQAYPFLAIPLAAFYRYIFSFNFKWQFFSVALNSITVFLLSSFMCLNIIQTYQYDHPLEHKLMHFDSMTKDAYWRVFAKFNISDDDYAKYNKELEIPPSNAAIKGEQRDR